MFVPETGFQRRLYTNSLEKVLFFSADIAQNGVKSQ